MSRLRGEKLGDLLFDVTKYTTTVVVIGSIFSKEPISMKLLIGSGVLVFTMVIIAYFTTPKE